MHAVWQNGLAQSVLFWTLGGNHDRHHRRPSKAATDRQPSAKMVPTLEPREGGRPNPDSVTRAYAKEDLATLGNFRRRPPGREREF
jgi:hypothetical protein